MLNPDSLIIIGFKGRSVSYLTGDLALSTVICQALTLHTQEQAEMVANMLVKHGLLDGYWVRPLMTQLAELN